MFRPIRITLTVVGLLVLVGGGAVNSPARAAQTTGEWVAVTPGGATTCALGTPYQFFARDGASDKLLIFFQGGGACWDDVSCGSSIYDPSVEASDSPAVNAFGIFDLDNPANPFADYDMVYVAYCTADVHTGSREQPRTLDGAAVTVHHQGVANAQAALKYAAEHFPAPESVFVAGCSAGSLGSIFHAPAIIEQYPGVPLVQLGDAAGAYRGNFATQLTAWGTLDNLPEGLTGYGATPEDVSFEQFYLAPAQAYPDVTFAQVNAANDLVQAMFLAFTGNSAPVHEALTANLDTISAAAPNFHYFVLGGSGHCVTDSPDFYAAQADGQSYRDWLTALVAGQDVPDVACTDCSAADWYE